MNIEVSSKENVQSSDIELVERKGLGHPDSICDGIAESVSRSLCREYLDRFGEVLHHNTDEAQLIAGKAEPEFGGGELKEKIQIILGGRATKEFQGEKIPVEDIAVEAAKEYIDGNFQKLSSDHIDFIPKIGETSTDLKSVFSDQKPRSNDTSFGVGHAPLSPVEKAVKQIEERVRTEIAEVGDDVKVMGLKRSGKMKVTIAAAVFSEMVEDVEEYKDVKKNVEKVAKKVAKSETHLDPEVKVNTADNLDEEMVYITYTGTSAENGDDGSVGRGNRVNGLITPYRAMSLEAASGKNPVTHVGKIYNFLAKEIAEAIYDRTGESAEVKILSEIGKPLDQPQVVDIHTAADEEAAKEIAEEKLKNVEEVSEECIDGEFSTF